MEPKIQNKRQKFPGSEYVETTDMGKYLDNNADNIFSPMDDFDNSEDIFSDDIGFSESVDNNYEHTSDDEDRRIEALKRAIDISKLMSNVTVETVINIAEQVDAYLKQSF